MTSAAQAGIVVRDAVDDDWPSIWEFFRAIVADGETYAYPEDLTSEQAQSLWMRQQGRCVVAVDSSGTVLGSATMGANRPGRGQHVGTASFMVSPAARGRGVGRLLGGFVVKTLRQSGFRGIQFNAVVETNEAAVALWRSLGFEVIGTVPRAFDSRRHGLVGLHVMYLELAGA